MPIDLRVDLRGNPGESNHAVVLSVHGEVDIATIQELESKIDSLPESQQLVIDLTATDFMDSTGVRLLMATHEKYRESGRELKVAVNGGPIGRLLEVTGVLTHLNAFPSVDRALGD